MPADRAAGPDRPDYAIRPATNADSAEIRAVLVTVLREYGLSPDPCGVDADLDDIERNYFARGGWFRVVEVPERDSGGRVAGCAGLYPLNSEDVEIRKMYLLPELRGLGIGRRLLEDAIEDARRLGYRRLRLETASALREAIALYRSAGFRRVARPAAADRCDQAWVLDIDPTAADARTDEVK